MWENAGRSYCRYAQFQDSIQHNRASEEEEALPTSLAFHRGHSFDSSITGKVEKHEVNNQGQSGRYYFLRFIIKYKFLNKIAEVIIKIKINIQLNDVILSLTTYSITIYFLSIFTWIRPRCLFLKPFRPRSS